MRRGFLMSVSAAAAAATAPAAWAQSAASVFPSRPVRIVVPYPPGALTDIIPRMVAERLRETWGQPLVVENRPGGSGRVAAEHVANAAPDGYTILVGLPDQLAIAPQLYRSAARFIRRAISRRSRSCFVRLLCWWCGMACRCQA